MERLTSFYTIDTIHSRLHHINTPKSILEISKKFALMKEKGNVKATLKLLTSNISNATVHLNDKTLSLLKQKHPASLHSVAFEDIDERMVKETTLKTRGGSGPKKSICQCH